MARQGGLDGDLGGFVIPYLAHHDDIRVLAEDGTQALRESDVGRDIDLALVDIGELILNRVLDRDDVAVFPVHAVEGGVEGGGLPRAGGAGRQDHPVGLGDEGFDERLLGREEPQVFELQKDGRLVENAHDDLLTEDGEKRGDPQVVVSAVAVDSDAAVLGKSPLGDVHAGHDLDAGDHRGLEALGDLHHVVEDAVDPVSDADVLLAARRGCRWRCR